MAPLLKPLDIILTINLKNSKKTVGTKVWFCMVCSNAYVKIVPNWMFSSKNHSI